MAPRDLAIDHPASASADAESTSSEKKEKPRAPGGGLELARRVDLPGNLSHFVTSVAVSSFSSALPPVLPRQHALLGDAPLARQAVLVADRAGGVDHREAVEHLAPGALVE